MPGMTASRLEVQVTADVQRAQADLKNFGATVDKLPGGLAAAGKASAASTAAFDAMGGAAKVAATSAGKIANPLQDAAKGAADFGKQKGAVSSTGDALASAGKQAGGLGDALAKLGLQGMGIQSIKTAVMGLAAPFEKAMSLAGDLQQSIANISTIKADINLDKAFADLNELSTKVPETATGLADAMYNIFSSIDVGYSDALALTESFAKGALAAQTSAETFGTSILGVMNAYGLAASDATHVSDVFFNTVNKGVITGQELAASLGPVTQSAKAAGLSLDELGGFIAGITKEGGPAAQNVNNLNNFLSKVTTADAQKALGVLGIQIADTTGNFRPMVDVLGDLKQRLAGMTAAAKLSAIQAIFPDAQARQGAMVLMSQLDMVKATIESNRTATGTAASAYEKMSNTYNTQTKLMQNTMDKAWREMGAQILPAITPIITAFAEQIPAAMHKAGAGIEFVQKHWETLEPIIVTTAAVISGQLVAAIGAWTVATVISNAALIKQAAAVALAYAPLIGLAAAVAAVVLVVRNFDDSVLKLLDTLSHLPLVGDWAAGQAAGLRAVDAAFRLAAQGADVFAHNLDTIKASPQIATIAPTFDAIVKSGATLDGQLLILNSTYGVFAGVNQLAAKEATNLAIASYRTATENEALQTTLAKTNLGMTTTADVAKKAGFEIIRLADGGVQFALSASQMATKTAAFNSSLLDAAGKGVPFGQILADIEKKAAEGANKIDLMKKAVHDLASEMTAGEAVMGRQSRAWDAVVSSAQALVTNRAPEAIATITARAKDMLAATDANAPSMKTISGLIDTVAKGGPAGAAAFETLKKKVDEAKKPIDDLSKSMADERGIAGDLAAETLPNLGKSMDGLKQALIDMVGTFMLSMGKMPLMAQQMSADVIAAWAGMEREAGETGKNAGQALAQGLRLQAGSVRLAAADLANAAYFGTVTSLDMHSPSRKFIYIGTMAGEGLAIGLRAKVADVEDAAGQMVDVVVLKTEDIDQHVRNMGARGSVSINEFLSGFRAATPVVVSFAQSLAALANDSLRPLQLQVANFDVQLAQLRVHLANTTAESAEAKAIEEQIAVLERAKGSYTAQIGAITAYRSALDLARTALDTFTSRSNALTQTSANTSSFGAGGSAIVDALTASITDPAAGARVADAVNTLLSSEAFRTLPAAGELGQSVWDSITAAMGDPSALNIQAVLDALGAVESATLARIQAMKPTLQSAFADALNADALAMAMGSSWGSVFAQTTAAIDAGTPLPVAALGRFAADALAQIAKLPQSMQADLIPQWDAAWAAFVADPSGETLAGLQGFATAAHEALSVIPKEMEKLAPEVQAIILDIAASVHDGALTIEAGAAMAGEAAKLIPAGFARELPEVRRLISGYVAAVHDGRVGIADAVSRINDITQLIPKNLHDLTPGVQADILSIVTAWQTGAFDIEEANRRIAAAVKAGADATEEAAKRMAAETARLAATVQSAMSAIGSTGGTSTSGPNGITVGASPNNALGVPGLSSSTVTEPGQQPTTTFTYQGQSWAVPGTGTLADVMAHFGFSSEAAFAAWLKAQQAAAAASGLLQGGAGASGGPGALQALLDFIAMLNGIPPAPHALGGVFARPTTMFDTSGRAHVFGEKGPEPFGSPATLRNMFGTPSTSQSSAVSGGGSGSSSTAPANVTQHNTINVTQLPGESGDQLAKRVVQILRQANQRQN